MSTFTHVNQGPVFNPTAKTTIPARWNHLLSDSLPYTKDTSLPGISRTVFEASSPGSPIHGEVWVASDEITGSSSAPKTFKVAAGNVQMYVLSGSGSVTKNGKVFFLRDGEKVSFTKDDAFSFPDNHGMRILVRNEAASFVEGSYVHPVSRLQPPTDVEVERLRAELGVTTTPLFRSFGYARRNQEHTSSSGYARSKVG